MSTAYSINRFAKPTKQELSKIDYFEPYDSFPVYDADGEQTNEHIRLFQRDNADAANIINSKFAKRTVLLEKTTDYEKLYRAMGFDENAIAEKRVRIKSGDGYTFEYTDGEQIILWNRQSKGKGHFVDLRIVYMIWAWKKNGTSIELLVMRKLQGNGAKNTGLRQRIRIPLEGTICY